MNITEAISGIQSNKKKIRNIAFQSLLPISEKSPEKKYVAIPLLSNLVRVDKENRFDKLFDDFYRLLQHESPVVSPHIARVSGRVINARPNLQNKILELLLDSE